MQEYINELIAEGYVSVDSLEFSTPEVTNTVRNLLDSFMSLDYKCYNVEELKLLYTNILMTVQYDLEKSVKFIADAAYFITEKGNGFYVQIKEGLVPEIGSPDISYTIIKRNKSEVKPCAEKETV